MDSCGRVCAWVWVALALVVTVVKAFPPIDKVRFEVVGRPVTMLNSTDYNCTADGLGPDNVDTPARAWVDAAGTVHLSASCHTSRLMSGPSLYEARHNCTVVHNSTYDARPSIYADNEWIHAVYALGKTELSEDTVFTMLHDEYHGFQHDNCKMQPFHKGYCQMFAMTAGVSTDGGWSWRHVAQPPAHRIAMVDHKYVDNDSQLWFGWGDSAGLVRHPGDGYLYTTAHNRASVGAQPNGTCLMRSKTPLDPASWRGWNGTGFHTVFTDPYDSEGAARAVWNHSHNLHRTLTPPGVCVPLEDGHPNSSLPRGAWRHEPVVHQGLVWSTVLRCFVGVFWNPSLDPTIEGGARFLFGVSDDLVAWSPLRPLPLPPNLLPPDLQYMYPALLDPNAPSLGDGRNFDVVGPTMSLFFTQATGQGTPAAKHWEGLVRLPLRLSLLA